MTHVVVLDLPPDVTLSISNMHRCHEQLQMKSCSDTHRHIAASKSLTWWDDCPLNNSYFGKPIVHIRVTEKITFFASLENSVAVICFHHNHSFFFNRTGTTWLECNVWCLTQRLKKSQKLAQLGLPKEQELSTHCSTAISIFWITTTTTTKTISLPWL